MTQENLGIPRTPPETLHQLGDYFLALWSKCSVGIRRALKAAVRKGRKAIRQ